MNNEVTTINGQLMNPASSDASLLDMRMDAKRFPRIGAFSREQAVIEISRIVSQAFLYRGQAADPTNIQFISCSLVDELQADSYGMGTRNISFAEISRVVKRAVLTDDMFGVSVSSLFKVITSYIKGEGHRLNQQVVDMRRKREEREVKDSIIAPMLQSYAGQFLKNTKV